MDQRLPEGNLVLSPCSGRDPTSDASWSLHFSFGNCESPTIILQVPLVVSSVVYVQPYFGWCQLVSSCTRPAQILSITQVSKRAFVIFLWQLTLSRRSIEIWSNFDPSWLSPSKLLLSNFSPSNRHPSSLFCHVSTSCFLLSDRIRIGI